MSRVTVNISRLTPEDVAVRVDDFGTFVQLGQAGDVTWYEKDTAATRALLTEALRQLDAIEAGQ